MVLRTSHEAQEQKENFQDSRGVSDSFPAQDFVSDFLTMQSSFKCMNSTALSLQPLICSLSSCEAWCSSHSAKCTLSALQQLKKIFNAKEMQCLSSH